jgi:hypothetical protein
MKLLEFTFGIITSEKSISYVDTILHSIYSLEGLSDENYEIVVVGGNERKDKNLIHVPFDNSPRIALKKNLITEHSSKENIVFLHDYFTFDSQWYMGFLEFGNHWDICMNMILNQDGRRFRDWVTWDAPENQRREGKSGLLVPYSYDKFKHMYISGGYWVAKKETMKKEPLNKWLQWSECEDLEWSKRVLRKGFKYKMNPLSVVHVIKPFKDTVFKYIQ